MKLFINPSYISELIILAKDAYPSEACALLFGDLKESIINVKQIVPLINADNSAVSFRINDNDLFHAYRMSETNGLSTIGIYHSHPFGSNFPSQTDREYMICNSVPWIIYSISEGNMRCFILNEKEEIEEIEIVSQ